MGEGVFRGNLSADRREALVALAKRLRRDGRAVDAAAVIELADGVEALAQDFRDLELIRAGRERGGEPTTRAAEARAASVSAFVVNMSQELRTPLNAIIGYAELVEEELSASGATDLLPDVGRIRGAGRHLLTLVNDILDIAKLEAGRLVLAPESFDVRALVEEVQVTVEPSLEENGNRLEVQIAPGLDTMIADPARVKQCLSNLVANANRFTEEGVVRLVATGDGDHVRFAVADTGIGMTPEQLSRLFRPFAQAGPEPDMGGTGLGLALARQLCLQMGGDLDAASRIGAGSTLTMTLPRDAARAVAPSPLPEAEPLAAPSEEPRQDAPFVGRAELVARLERELAGALEERRPTATVITGAPGFGKTRLAEELARRLQQRTGATVWRARGETLRVGSAFALLGRALRDGLGLREGDAGEQARAVLGGRVASLVPAGDAPRVAAFLGELVGVPFPDAHGVQLESARRDPALMDDQRTRAWLDWLGAATSAGPVVLLADDLQWADRPSVRLLRAALGGVRGRPFVVLGAGRPDALPDDLGAVVEIGPLSDAEAEELAAILLGSGAGDSRVQWIRQRSAGNPQFVEELARQDDARAVPDSLAAAVRARLERLEPQALRVLLAASVYGTTFWRRAVSALLVGDADGGAAVDAGMLVLQQHDLVEPHATSRFPGEDEYAFRSEVVREVTVGMLTDRERAGAHRLAADWLVAAGLEDAVVLAHHFEKGGEVLRALEWCRRGAEQALAAQDLDTALALAERGLRFGARGEALGALEAVRAEVRRWRGDHDAALRSAETAAAVLPEGSASWFRAMEEAIQGHGRKGDYARAAAQARLVASTAPAAGAADAQLRCLCLASRQVFHAGRYDLADALLALAESVPGPHDPLTRAELHRLRGARARHRGDLEGDVTGYAAALAAYEEAGDERSALNCRVSLGFGWIEVGRTAQAERELERAWDDADRMGLATVSTRARQNLALVRMAQGRLDEARRLADDVVEESRAAGNLRFEGWTRIYAAQIALQAGDTALAERQARAAAELLAPSPPARAGAVAVLARILVRCGRPDEARASAEDALAVLDRYGGIEEFESIVWLAAIEAFPAEARRAVTSRARERLEARAAAIGDSSLRESFLRTPENQRLLEVGRPAEALATAWDADRFRRDGHALVERLAAWLEESQRAAAPVWDVREPDTMVARWELEGGDALPWADRLLADAVRQHHPRYAGYQVSPALPMAALADLAASLVNNGMASYDSGPPSSAMEDAVVRFMAARVGFPRGDGLLTSGGSLGNLTALLAARRVRGGRELAILATDQAHYSIGRAAGVMGLDADAVVAVPTDERYRLRPEALPAAVAQAEARGRRVLALVVNAGSTSTGSVDPLEAAADFCAEHGFWLHVDAAHGATAVFSPRHAGRLRGIERADSVVWDAHKLMALPALVTAVLFRDAAHARATFAQEAAYLYAEGRALDRGLRTIECTKRMMAVPLWVALRELGEAHFGAAVDACFDLATVAAQQISADPELELCCPPDTNIVCFRVRAAEDQDRVRDAVNRSGRAFVSRTELGGRTWLRLAFMNPLATEADVDAILGAVRDAVR